MACEAVLVAEGGCGHGGGGGGQAEDAHLREWEEKLKKREDRIDRLAHKLRQQRDKLKAAQEQAKGHANDYEVGGRQPWLCVGGLLLGEEAWRETDDGVPCVWCRLASRSWSG